MGHLVDLVRHHSGLDLRVYRQALVGQRLERRMASTRTDSLESYVSLLREQPREIGRLARALRTSASSTTPDRVGLDQLAAAVERVVVGRRSNHARLRVWIPACSTGEEAYLLAMLLAAALTRHSCNPRDARIIASDPDEASLMIARRGVFSAPHAFAGIPTALRATGLRLDGRGKRVVHWLRNMIRFQSHDVTREPPPRNVDLIVCRNLLAGLQPRLRRRVLGDLRDALQPGGYLLLGSTDSVSSAREAFTPVGGEARLYRRHEPAASTNVRPPETTTDRCHEIRRPSDAPATLKRELDATHRRMAATAEDFRQLQDSVAHPLIVVDDHLRVIVHNRAARAIFGFGDSDAGKPLFSLPCRIDPAPLRDALMRTMRDGTPAEYLIDAGVAGRVRVGPYPDQATTRRELVIAVLDDTPDQEIRRQLAESGRRLEAAERFTALAFDALSDEICIVDQDGVIIAVNAAWCAFGEANGGRGAHGLGLSYLAVCEQAAAQGDTAARRLLLGLRAVLRGDSDVFSEQYPCHSPTEERWFNARVSAFVADGERYAVVSHDDVSAPRQLEAHLQLHSRALDASTDGILITDLTRPDMPLIHVNAAFEKLTGYSRDEVLGRNCRFLQGPDRDHADQAEALDRLRAALRTAQPCQVLLRNYRRDGSLFWNELSVYPVADEAGSPRWFVGVQADRTAVVAAQQGLQASRAREKLALAFAGAGAFEWDIRSGRITGSETTLVLLGLDPSLTELDYDTLRGRVEAADRPLLDDAVKLCLAGRASVDLEFRVSWPDGSVHWLHLKGDVEPDAQGIPLGRSVSSSTSPSARTPMSEFAS